MLSKISGLILIVAILFCEMACAELEKEIVNDKIEILEDGHIQVREVTRIIENGKVRGKSYRRWVLEPGQDVETQKEKVKNVSAAVWTEEVVAKHEAKKALEASAVLEEVFGEPITE